MSSDEDDERVKLYNPLERNRKRQHFVSLSSSESDSETSSLGFAAESDESPFVRKSRRRSLRQDAAARAVELADDDDDVETLMTEAERAAARQSELQIEREIAQRIAQDALLSQTREIINKTTSTQRQISLDTAADLREIISLDSDDDDDDDVQILTPGGNSAIAGLRNGSAATASSNGVGGNQRPQQQQSHHNDKGERIILKIRSNGERTDDVPIHMKEPFDVLYKNFCDLLGLPRSAVHMNLDGEALSLTATPASNDLETGDLIDAKVDFSKQRVADMKKFVRLRLVVEGRRPEVFKIDVASTIEKLQASFCKKHSIEFAQDVTLSALGAKLRLSDTIESYELRDDDEITVEIENFVDPSAIAVQLRFGDGTVETHHIVPSAKVESLQSSIAHLRNTSAQHVSLRLDGEAMASSRSFQYYDLEGGELIEVKIAS